MGDQSNGYVECISGVWCSGRNTRLAASMSIAISLWLDLEFSVDRVHLQGLPIFGEDVSHICIPNEVEKHNFVCTRRQRNVFLIYRNYTPA